MAEDRDQLKESFLEEKVSYPYATSSIFTDFFYTWVFKSISYYRRNPKTFKPVRDSKQHLNNPKPQASKAQLDSRALKTPALNPFSIFRPKFNIIYLITTKVSLCSGLRLA